ncbi:MAG: hypothetical protein QOF48_248 [Verrucomicrobiota bacterium]|jgi:hypothetical protein
MPRRLYKFTLVCLAALFVIAAATCQRRMNRQRAELGLTRVEPLENAPPVLAFTTVALGGFRGLIANALWIRANDLQQEDKFFEQVQLSSWITKLEPHFTQVWLVQSWNMAYNISVKFRDPYDRWRWVQRGIELLRDDGLRFNPKEALIYRELAWFYQHKIGQNLDDAHLFYKFELAHEMQRVLGGGRPNFEELLHPQSDEARARVKVLREKYKMDPAVMQEADKLYGPLDWRLPEASAIYWAVVGLEKSNRKDLVTLRRVIYQCLHMLVMRGRIVLEQPDGTYVFGPDLNKVTAANDGYEKMLAEETEKPIVVRTAQRNFLRESVYILYTNNRLAEADKWMAVLKQKYPEAVPPDESVETFALKRLAGSITDIDQKRTVILLDGLLKQHFHNMAIGEADRSAGLLLMARKVYDYYQSSVQRRAVIALRPFQDMYQSVLNDLLDPTNGLPRVFRDRLRTEKGLPPEPLPSTNAPPVIRP